MNKLTVFTAVFTLALGAGGGYWFAVSKMEQQPHIMPISTEATEVKKPLFYRSPMNPAVTSPVPAKDTMGMDYVPVYADDNNQNDMAGSVKIDPVTEQNIGVRTALAKKMSLSHIVHAVGRITYDEEHIVRLHPKTEGWIETLRVDKTGEKVGNHQMLLSIYSPQLVASQQEYILALDSQKILEASPIEEIRRGAKELAESSRERLKLLDVPDHQLHELTNSHALKKSLHIHSPAAGIVINIGAREGQYVTPETELYMIADLATVWVYADIYEHELPWVKEGDAVEMRLAGVPDRVFKGHLAFIYPYAEAKTRTIKVRLIFDNSEQLLKPDMFADVTIHAGKQAESVVIPVEAVVRSGAKNQVFVVREKGKFEPREITTGLSSENDITVLSGLKEGEEVVTSAQFLIDSESKLREATEKMIAPKSEQGAHKHD